MPKEKVNQKVRRFYNKVGWQEVSDGVFQNALYEDLRPVSSNYIHKCHLRINSFLQKTGKYFLDAGSGPIQYSEYLAYSEGYQYRVCLDVSIVALTAAKQKIGDHGFFIVGDISKLPFRNDIFSDIVSLHTIHHLPIEGKLSAYNELKRALKEEGNAVIVNGWDYSPLMDVFQFPIRLMEKLVQRKAEKPAKENENSSSDANKPEGTFVKKQDAAGLRLMLGDSFPIKISVWRSVSVRFLRALIHPFLFGRFTLWVIYSLEELFPKFFGENGQYPMIIFTK